MRDIRLMLSSEGVELEGEYGKKSPGKKRGKEVL